MKHEVDHAPLQCDIKAINLPKFSVILKYL